jgi:hypothetical protein
MVSVDSFTEFALACEAPHFVAAHALFVHARY